MITTFSDNIGMLIYKVSSGLAEEGFSVMQFSEVSAFKGQINPKSKKKFFSHFKATKC